MTDIIDDFFDASQKSKLLVYLDKFNTISELSILLELDIATLTNKLKSVAEKYMEEFKPVDEYFNTVEKAKQEIIQKIVLWYYTYVENPCDNCPPGIKGSCCFYSVLMGANNIFLLKHPCKYLDLNTGDCTIYNKRNEVLSSFNCSNPLVSLEKGNFPKHCFYYIYFPALRLRPPKVLFSKVHKALDPNDKMSYKLCQKSKHDMLIEYKKPQ